MTQYGDIVPVFIRYGFKTLPEARKQYASSKIMQQLCIPSEKRSIAATISSENTPGPEMLPCILTAQLPGKDTEGFMAFAHSVLSICELIETYRHNKDISQELEIRRLYSCLACAVDPSRNSSCPMLHSIKNKPRTGTAEGNEPSAQTCLSDHCRLQLAVLPSYRLIASKMKKYLQFFIDLQAYRYYPPLASVEMLKVWSSGYLQRYHDINWWEFCAASDSLSGVFTMYAAAARPELSNEEVALLDEACFPWLCGMDSLLGSVLRMRTQEVEGLNFASFYSNLKECEERIIFFAEKATASFARLRNGEIYCNILQVMISMYLTEPEAEFGMLKLASPNILKKCSAVKYANAWRLLRMAGFMRQTACEE